MANGQTPVYPHMPKTDDRCVRLIIDFSSMEEMVAFARDGLATPYMLEHPEDKLHIYKVTASQYHSVPVGNHYIVAEGGDDDLKLTPDRIATILPPEEGVAEEENYNDHRDKDAF